MIIRTQTLSIPQKLRTYHGQGTEGWGNWEKICTPNTGVPWTPLLTLSPQSEQTGYSDPYPPHPRRILKDSSLEKQSCPEKRLRIQTSGKVPFSVKDSSPTSDAGISPGSPDTCSGRSCPSALAFHQHTWTASQSTPGISGKLPTRTRQIF